MRCPGLCTRARATLAFLLTLPPTAFTRPGSSSNSGICTLKRRPASRPTTATTAVRGSLRRTRALAGVPSPLLTFVALCARWASSAIRTATIWLTEHLRAAGIVAVMLTQDEGNRTKARAEGCLSSSGASFMETIGRQQGDAGSWARWLDACRGEGHSARIRPDALGGAPGARRHPGRPECRRRRGGQVGHQLRTGTVHACESTGKWRCNARAHGRDGHGCVAHGSTCRRPRSKPVCPLAGS